MNASKKNPSGTTQRLFINRGYLLVARTITGPDGNEYDSPNLEYQIFSTDGAPTSLNYEGIGSIDGDRLIIGDPYRDTQLLEAKILWQPTSRSNENFRGFVTAIDEKRKPKDPGKKHPSHIDEWWWGYTDGWNAKLEKKKSKKKSNPEREELSHAKRLRIAEDTVRKYGNRSTWRQRIRGGVAHGMFPRDFCPSSLIDGIVVELEHTTDPLIAMEIAMDHLAEDRKYYDKLKKMHRDNPGSMDQRTYAAIEELRDSTDDLALRKDIERMMSTDGTTDIDAILFLEQVQDRSCVETTLCILRRIQGVDTIKCATARRLARGESR